MEPNKSALADLATSSTQIASCHPTPVPNVDQKADLSTSLSPFETSDSNPSSQLNSPPPIDPPISSPHTKADASTSLGGTLHETQFSTNCPPYQTAKLSEPTKGPIGAAPDSLQTISEGSRATTFRDLMKRVRDMNMESDMKRKMAELESLVNDLGGQDIPADYRTLMGRVKDEINIWVNKGPGAMLEYNAQFELLGTVANMISKTGKYDSNPLNQQVNQPLEMYIAILRDANANEPFPDEERDMMLIAISDSEERSGKPNDSITEANSHAQLDTLHAIFDTHIARHSLGKAIQLLKHMHTDDVAQSIFPISQTAPLDVAATRAPYHTERGISAIIQFEQLGDDQDLEDAVAQFTEAVSFTPFGSADRPGRLRDLGASLIRRFERFGAIKDIEEAIKYQSEAVSLTPLASLDLPQRLNDLGTAFMRRFERWGGVKDIDIAIELQSEAVEFTPPNSADRPGRLNNLGNSLLCRFKRLSDVKDMEIAILRQIEAVDLTPVGHPELPGRLSNLGGSLLYRFTRFNKTEDIDAAIERQSQAVSLIPRNRAYRYILLNNLGLSFMTRFKHYGDVKDIDAAIERQSEAVELTSPNSANRATLLGSLGNSFMRRFERFGGIKYMEAAIKRQSEAVALTPHNSAILPIRLRDLGGSLLRRFEWLGDIKDINSAIKRQSEALNLIPQDSASRPTILDNLGLSLTTRFVRFGGQRR